MKEKEYPIWVVSARWNNKGYQNNGTAFTVSHRIKYSDLEMQKKAEKWWKGYCKKKYTNEIPELLELKVSFKGKDVWFGTWFAHKSLNRFENEKDAFESFRKYFWSLKRKPHTSEWDSQFITKDGYEYCVMGAEDEWRWKYCDCKICKKNRHTIIQH